MSCILDSRYLLFMCLCYITSETHEQPFMYSNHAIGSISPYTQSTQLSSLYPQTWAIVKFFHPSPACFSISPSVLHILSFPRMVHWSSTELITYVGLTEDSDPHGSFLVWNVQKSTLVSRPNPKINTYRSQASWCQSTGTSTPSTFIGLKYSNPFGFNCTVSKFT